MGDIGMVVRSLVLFSGDFRVNHVPGLTVQHTIFLRQHNRIATGLALLNLHWDDERIFQETRKIIIGSLQHLVYNQLLPTILRKEDMDRYGLWSNDYGYSNSYDPSEDVSIMMGFSAAAMRFPHTRIPNVQSMVNKDYTIRQDAPIFETFDKPKFVLQNLGKALADFARWLVSFPVMEDDRFVEDGVRDFLFLDDKGESFDLVALNLQRAREQGIPPYNHWRRLCGLKPAMYFSNGPGGLIDHEPEVVKLFSKVYRYAKIINLLD
jgi:peroxidase